MSEVQVDFDTIGDSDGDVEVLQPESSQPDPYAEIEAMILKQREQLMTYIDHRFVKVNETMNQHTEMIASNAQRISALEKAIATGQNTQQASAPQWEATDAKAEKEANGNILDTTLGTIGNVAHGLVDTAAFLCESVIDLATLGRARRAR